MSCLFQILCRFFLCVCLFVLILIFGFGCQWPPMVGGQNQNDIIEKTSILIQIPIPITPHRGCCGRFEFTFNSKMYQILPMTGYFRRCQSMSPLTKFEN